MLRNTLASTGVGTFESFSNPGQKDKQAGRPSTYSICSWEKGARKCGRS